MLSNQSFSAVSSDLACAEGRNSFAHIIGVKVSETMAEIKMATARVIANSLNKRPTTSLINNKGMSTAIKETVKEIIVKPICSEPFSAAFKGDSPRSI